MARSGTTVTLQALQGHPNVRACMDELKVTPFFTQGVGAFTVSGVNDYERDHSYGLLLDAMTMIPCSLHGKDLMGYGGTDAFPKGEILASGVKVAVSTIDEAELLSASLAKYESLKDVAIVRVERRDLVAQCASLWRAKRSGRWHSFYSSPATVADPKAPFEIPEGDFHFYCDEAAAVRGSFDRLAKSHRVIEVSYEDEIARMGPAAFQRTFSFLGLPQISPTWLGSEKVAPPIESFVLNSRRLYEILAKKTAAMA